MKVRCFECGELINAEDTEAAIHAFVAHGCESHTWSYPEEAVRDYARNYAEATERLTGDTERLPAIPDVKVHSVTEDRIDDWLRFFDLPATRTGPHAIAWNLTYRPRRTDLNVHGATQEQRSVAGFEAELPSDTLRMWTTVPWVGSTPHFVPTTDFFG